MLKLEDIFLQSIEKAQNILISTHLFPDADGIGSQIALGLALQKRGICTYCVNEEPLPARYSYLNASNIVISRQEYARLQRKNPFSIDLFIVIDANTLDRVGEKTKKIGQNAKAVLFVDHHPSASSLKATHCIDHKKAAAGEIVGDIIDALKVDFSPDIAQALYVAILVDTNCFRYPSVSDRTHQLVSRLLKSGVDPTFSYQQIYGAKKIEHIQCLGTILSSVQFTRDKSIAWFTITNQLLKKYNVSAEDTYSFINYLLVLDRVKVVCLFREVKGYIKISLRSTFGINVENIAQAFGGGGHGHSAAALVKGTMQQVKKDAIKRIQMILKSS